MQPTQKQIIAIIADTLGVDDVSEITREAEFYADLNASDTEVAQIIKTLEEKFDLELGLSNPAELNNVAQLIDLVEEAFI